MPDHIKALVAILGLATLVFAAFKASGCAVACSLEEFKRRRNLWIAVTLIAFLSHNFWIFTVAVGILLWRAQRVDANKIALYFGLLLALPRISEFIPGFGVVENFFSIDYQRLLVLTVLLPAFLVLRSRPDTEPLGRSIADKLLLGYVVLTPALMLTYSSITVTVRHGVFNVFIDVFLPYYVASRSLRDVREFRDALMAFVIAVLVLCATLAFEFLRQWLLYASLADALGTTWGWLNYTGRGGHLRAQGPVGHGIAAGYVVAVGIGFALYARKLVPSPNMRTLGLLLLAAGLVAPLSRGPWLGCAAMLLVFAATDRAPAPTLVKAGLFCVVAVPLLLVSPIGDSVIDYLPFVGTVESANVDFRKRLAEASIQVFLENPILGRADFLESPLMEALRGADGLIDMVNTYATIGLSSGIVGLVLFVGFFAAVLVGIYRGMQIAAGRDEEHYLLGQALFATLVGILIIIGTAASVLVVAAVYWVVAGVGVAYAGMMQSAPQVMATGHAGGRMPISKRRT